MSDDQQITSSLTVGGEPASQHSHQTNIVVGQPVSEPHDALVLGEPVLADAQPIANGEPDAARVVEVPDANQDLHVPRDRPTVNGDPEPLAREPPESVVRAQEGSSSSGSAQRSVDDPHAEEAPQETVVEPVNHMDEETQESAIKEEEEREQKSGFDRRDRSASGIKKPLIVAGMLLAVLGVAVAGFRKAH